ncbi:18789_t:CDS:2, partial [Gigaspora rosea]
NAPQPLAGIIVWFQEKGWMDESGISKWVKYWNNARPGPSFKKCGISNCLLGSEDHLNYATDDESDENKIEDFDDGEEEKFDEDNEDEEFDENEEFNKIQESDKDDECNGDESDSDKSDGDESDGDESDGDKSNNRVGKCLECFVVVEKLCK